jgi:hypothetical protein
MKVSGPLFSFISDSLSTINGMYSFQRESRETDMIIEEITKRENNIIVILD